MEANQCKLSSNAQKDLRKTNKISVDLNHLKKVPQKERSASQSRPSLLSPLNDLKQVPLSERACYDPKLKRNTVFTKLPEIYNLQISFKRIEIEEEVALEFVLEELNSKFNS